jgi:hypothetical protein
MHLQSVKYMTQLATEHDVHLLFTQWFVNEELAAITQS